MTSDLSTSSPIANPQDLVAIWYDSNTNATTWTRMSGSTIVERQTVANIPALDWKLAATGDFNNDGQIDLLWRNQYTGDSQWWLMKQGKIIGAQVIQTVANPNWQIAGTGDFNQDGQLDIFWRNSQGGQNIVWIMPSTDVSKILNPANWQFLESKNLDYDLAATGDVNQNRALDILWVDRPTGSAQWSQIQQPGQIPVSSLSDRLSADQRITTSADLNGDGALDLVVKDVTLGTSDLWMMSKAAINGTISTISRLVVTSDARLGQNLVGQTIVGIMMDAGNTLATAAYESDGRFTRSQTIGGLDDKLDYYRFGLGTAGVFRASLSGLSADADVRIIKGRNVNGTVEAGEVVAWNWERGTKAESLEVFLSADVYYLEVRSYDDKLTNYQLSTSFVVPASNPLAQAAQPPSKLDIQFAWDTSITALERTKIEGSLENAAQFWEGVLFAGGTLLPGGVLPIKISLENLNLKTGAPDDLTLAYTAPTIGSDGQKLLIQGATLTINRRRLGTIGTTSLNDLFIHEFTHALGFGTLWEPFSFRMPDGSIKSIGFTDTNGGSLINRSTNRYSANSNAGWAYGELLRDAGRATTVQQTAVPIEAGFAAHWDESIFQTESLTPVANSGTQPISILTLAALKDLGWQVNFGKAQDYKLKPVDSTGSGIDYTNVNRPIAAGSVMAANWVTEWPVG